MDKLKTKALAYRGVDLWLNLEISKGKDNNYEHIENLLKQRFKTDNLNPLLEVLGLLEMSLIEDALRDKKYLDEHEKEIIIRQVVDDLAKNFKDIVTEMESILGALSDKISFFKTLSQKYRKGGS